MWYRFLKDRRGIKNNRKGWREARGCTGIKKVSSRPSWALSPVRTPGAILPQSQMGLNFVASAEQESLQG